LHVERLAYSNSVRSADARRVYVPFFFRLGICLLAGAVDCRRRLFLAPFALTPISAEAAQPHVNAEFLLAAVILVELTLVNTRRASTIEQLVAESIDIACVSLLMYLI
jgi:hypothetical protein